MFDDHPVQVTLSGISSGALGKWIEEDMKFMGNVTNRRITEEYAKNFEERTKAPWHEFGRVVTVYVDRVSTGVLDAHKIAEDTYVDFFIVHPGFVTVHTWVSKGTVLRAVAERF